MTLGQRIQMCRKRRGLSQEQLGEQIGVSRQAVSKWEQDTARPDLDKIVALSQLFELTADELLKGIPGEAEDDGTDWPIDPNAPFRGWRGRKLPYTKFQIGCRIAGCLLGAGMFLYLLLQYQTMPSTIPVHWGISGVPDRWGSKSSVFWMFLLGVILYIGMEVLCGFPSIWNMTGNLTEGNWRHIYTTMRSMLELTNVILLAMFCYLSLPTIFPWLPVSWPIVLFLSAYTLLFILGMLKIYKIGKKRN